MAPAGVSTLLGHAVIGHCRRVVYRDGTSKMYGGTNLYAFERLEGPSDDSVEFIYTYDRDRVLTGVIINVCCPAQTVENKLVTSADFVGAFRQQLAEKLGRDLPVLTVIGAAGDQSPRDLVRQRGAKDPSNPHPGKVWSRGEPSMREFEGAEELGRRLVHSFFYDLDKADAAIRYEFAFAHRFDYLPVKIRTVTEAEYAAAKERMRVYEEKYRGDWSACTPEDAKAVSPDASVCSRWERQNRSLTYAMPVHLFRIGDAAAVTCPMELFLEYGLRIRARVDAEHLLLAELTDDEVEYLPTPFAVEAKSYSAMVSNQLVSCEGGETFVETSIERLNALFDGR